GGVRYDVSRVQQANADAEARRTSDPGGFTRAALALPWAVDVPLSVVGDVVTWPYTAAYTCINAPVPGPTFFPAPPPVVPPPLPAPAEAQPQASPPADGPKPGEKATSSDKPEPGAGR